MQIIVDTIQAMFFVILNMSITASVIIVFVFLSRLCLKRAPRGFSYALWAVVLFRLLCPVSVSLPASVLSLVGATVTEKTIVSEVQYISSSAFDSTVVEDASAKDVTVENDVVEDSILLAEEESDASTAKQQTEKAEVSTAQKEEDSASNDVASANAQTESVQVLHETAQKKLQAWFSLVAPIALSLASGIWFLGVLFFFAVNMISVWQLKEKLKRAVLCQLQMEQSAICYTAYIPTAFVLGVIKPRVFLPATLSPHEQAHILLHEQVHIARRDPFWQSLAFLALCVHWFNPLVWLAFKANQQDMELSCDERVLRTMGNDVKKEYAQSLLNLSRGQGGAFHTVLAFGESDATTRIKNVLAYRKPFWLATNLASVMLIAVNLLLIANPVAASTQASQDDVNSASPMIDVQSFDAIGNEAEISEQWDMVSVGLSTKQVESFAALIQEMHQFLLIGWESGDCFSDYAYPNSAYWNYFHETGEIWIGTLYNENDWILQEVYGLDEGTFYRRYGATYERVGTKCDWDSWVRALAKYQVLFQEEEMKADIAQLVEYITLAQETHRVEYLTEVYYMVHDMDYFLLQYAVPYVANAIYDHSAQTVYYASLKVWQDEYGLRERITPENLPALTLPVGADQSLHTVAVDDLQALFEQQWSYRTIEEDVTSVSPYAYDTYGETPNLTDAMLSITDLDEDGCQEIWLFYECKEKNTLTSTALVVEQTDSGGFYWLGVIKDLPSFARLEETFSLYETQQATLQLICNDMKVYQPSGVVISGGGWNSVEDIYEISIQDNEIVYQHWCEKIEFYDFKGSVTESREHLFQSELQVELHITVQDVFVEGAAIEGDLQEELVFYTLCDWRNTCDLKQLLTECF